MELAKGNIAFLVGARAVQTGNEQVARRAADLGEGQSNSFRSVLAKRAKGDEGAPRSHECSASQNLKPAQEQAVEIAMVDRQQDRQVDQQPVDEVQPAQVEIVQESIEQLTEETNAESVVKAVLEQIADLIERADGLEDFADEALVERLAALFGELEQLIVQWQATVDEEASTALELLVDNEAASALLLNECAAEMSDLKQAVQEIDLAAEWPSEQLREIVLRAEATLKKMASSFENATGEDLQAAGVSIDFSKIERALSDLIAQIKMPDKRAVSRPPSDAAVELEQPLDDAEAEFRPALTGEAQRGQERQLNENSDSEKTIKSVERRGEGVVFDVSGETSEQVVVTVEDKLVAAPSLAKANVVANQNGLALRTAVFEQVKVAIEKSSTIIASNDHSEMIIRLKPEELGKVELKIEVHNDNVIARFNVASQVVKEAIESNLQDLRNSLKDKGFNEMTFDVDVNQGGDGRGGFQQNRGRRRALQIPTDVERGEASYIKSLSAMINDASFEYLA